MLEARQFLHWNLHKHRFFIIDCMIANNEVNDIATPSILKRMVYIGTIYKGLIELYIVIDFLGDCWWLEFWEVVDNENCK